jgi:ubiquinone/menaquinone biosynthesis C-methylase UbiE
MVQEQTLARQSSEPEPTGLSWTGERLVPTEVGQTAVEHLHRYAIATDLAHGKVVLDLASGEGYGSNILAQAARRVIGVDNAREAVTLAQRRYGGKNLAFVVGDCAAIPLETSSVNLVVSFETLEHHDQHEAMITEIARVLRSDGILIISSPNKHEYSDIPQYKNPFHLAELYLDQFSALLKLRFNNVSIYGQRLSSGSYVAPTPLAESLQSPYITYTGDFSRIKRYDGIDRPVYFIAAASNGPLPQIGASLFDGEAFLLDEKERVIKDLRQELELSQAQLAEKDRENARDRLFAEAVRATCAYRFYRKFIKPFKAK